MNRIEFKNQFRQLFYLLPTIVCIVLSGMMLNCSRQAEAPKSTPSRPSDIKVEVHDGGPIVVTTNTAEFQILPSGFVEATLLKNGQRLTLDEPGPTSTGGSDSIVHEGKELDFIDFQWNINTEFPNRRNGSVN